MSTFRLNFVPRNLGLFGQLAVANRTLDLDTNFRAWHVHTLDLLLPYCASRNTYEGILSEGWLSVILFTI